MKVSESKIPNVSVRVGNSVFVEGNL